MVTATQNKHEFVNTRKRLDLLKLAGKINFRDDYDYKNCREGK